MSFPGYPEYKSCCMKWIGDIPAHWQTLALKRVALFKSGNTIGPDQITNEGEYPVYGGNGLRGYTDAYTHEGFFPLVGRQGALCGNINYSSGRFWASEHAVVVTALRPLEPKWLGELLRAMNLGQYSVSAAQPGLSVEIINNLQIPLPPLPEQYAISAFLDRETAKIDALVAEQEKLIELLKEKRQAVISHAVTKGLDPNVPMKDSGVEWLGEVPEHWRVVPLMHLTEQIRPIMYGIVLPGPDVEDGVPIVKGGDVKSHRLKKELLCRTTPEIEAPFARARLLPNDIVYSIRGTIGDVELVPEALAGANITQDVARISPRSEINFRWLFFTVQSEPVFTQLRQRSLGAAVPGINIFDLKRARIPVPPKEEQLAIVEALLRHVSVLDNLKVEAQRAIDLLKERRSALISAAVTGKIDVREKIQLDQ